MTIIKKTSRRFDIPYTSSDEVVDEINQIDVMTSVLPDGKLKFVLYLKGFIKYANGGFGTVSSLINLPENVAENVCLEILESISINNKAKS